MELEKHKGYLSSHLDNLLSAGQVVFSREDASKKLSIGQGAFLDAAERLQKQGRLLRPRQGFYVVVPAQYRSWGTPPLSWYIDDLMRHENRLYYVGLLKAAELHGATHQAVMEFQVVTDKRMPRISVGKSTIAFYYRKDLKDYAAGIESRKTDTGYMKISSVELTVFDLLRYSHAAGGLDNIITVISDLGGKVDPEKLASLASMIERPFVQRAGYLLDRCGFMEKTEKLHDSLFTSPSPPWVELQPSAASDPDFTLAPVEENKRWRVVVRRWPEIDE